MKKGKEKRNIEKKSDKDRKKGEEKKVKVRSGGRKCEGRGIRRNKEE